MSCNLKKHVDVFDYKKLQYADKQAYEKAKAKDGTFIWWKPPVLDTKYRPKPYASKTIKDSISQLCEETATNLKELIELHIGVDSIHDIYENETGKIVTYLLKVTVKMDEEK